MASLLRAQLAHARLYPASEHPELPPATATALPTRPQSPRVTRRLQPKSTSAFPLSLLVLLAWSLSHPSVLSSAVWVCVMSTLPARIPCVASAVAAGSAMTACASAGSTDLSSAQLGSSPSRWHFLRATSHAQQRHTDHVHLFCILIHTTLRIFTTSAAVQGIRDDTSYRGGLVHPCLLWLAPTSISFPYIPCCHCARQAAASSGTQHPILEPTPNPWRS